MTPSRIYLHYLHLLKTRSDKVLEPKCKYCEYTTKNLTCMKVHCLTHHSTKEDRKKEFKYYCDKCDFGTYAEILFTRHCETKKHNDITPSQL